LGLYFEEDYLHFLNSKCNSKIVFWNGLDVSRLLQNEKYKNLIHTVNKNVKHFCHNEILKQELKTIKINDVEIMPLFFDYKKNYCNCSLKQKNTVFMCAHEYREIEYGVNFVIDYLAHKFTNFIFHIYGISDFNNCKLKNVIFHGQIEEKIMNEEIKKYEFCLRMNKHDGVSQIVIKSILYGIKPIVSNDINFIEQQLINYNQNYNIDFQDLKWFDNLINNN